MSDSLTLFLDHIDSLPENVTDPGAAVARAYHDSLDELADLKESVRLYIVPGKDARGRWMPVFDADRTDDIANLSSKIEQAQARIKSIRNDINLLIELGDGPSFWPLANKLRELRNQTRNVAGHAAKITQRAIEKNPGVSLEQINEMAEVQAAYQDLEALKAETEPQIAALAERYEAQQKIYGRYEA